MRLLITGDRNWKDESSICSVIDMFAEIYPDLEVIHGGANGADSIAGDLAEFREIKVLVFRADWSKYGRAAGPIRNQQMLDEAKPNMVYAFHPDLKNSRGTLDMVKRARKANLPVTWVDDKGIGLVNDKLDDYLKTC
jgi:hypothetical protein